ncbi:MAG: squalene/phytoene synthase family protein [Gammaproteobacteria bacterium]|nr:squalene/phytoene synthase family protein [Gammaproteobacteria bacterium]NIM73496.1 squalene/phytoene synthase family protein [Gammaproteobacteria bacterium]NIN39905.1 squalene/phytoene synthase family protein [Gammaproteobacteria bacterium]NIO25305.1 squalene/phytoene synthase family protein [Gammaproteobacteria bacterium]NIO65932.1 squalene/phytoene synthase family protein [Gammaproteobacteria bacterium]
MSPYDYCREKVALPGSSLYYSLLFVSPALREALTALHAAAEEFRAIAEQVREAGVARTKLGWWAEEIERAACGAPRHPITRALAQPLREAGVDSARFAGVLNAFVAHHERDAYGTFAELEAHFDRVADLTGCIAAQLCGFACTETVDASRSLGVGLALAELARSPYRPDARRATDLPADLLAECGVSRADLGATPTTEPVRRSVRKVCEAARLRLRDALEAMPVADRGAQRPRRALAEMMLAQLDAIERGAYAVSERPAAITPLRKLWIAWKHRG